MWNARRALPRVLITAACVAGLFVVLDAGSLLAHVKSFVLGSPAAFGIAIGAFLALHFLGALKWRLFLAVAGARLSVPVAARCYGFGLFANLCLPSVIGGDVLRTVLAMKEEKGRKEAVLFGGVVDRVADLLALGSVVLVGALLVPGAFSALGEASGGARALLLVFFAGLLLGLVALGVVLGRRGRRGPRRLVRLRMRLLRAWRASRRRPGMALCGLLIALFMQSSFCLVNVWIGTRMGLELDWRIWLFTWPLAKIAGMVPISLGGIGVREVAFAGFLKPFGIHAELVVAQSFVWEAVLVLGGLMAGAAAFLTRRRT